MSGLFKGETKTYVVSSPLKGTLMKDGVALSNTVIIRRIRWNSNDEGIEQEFKTSEGGEFDLPIHKEDLTLSPLTEFVAKTDLYAIFGNERVHFWFIGNGEWEEEPVGVICDLEDEFETIHIKSGLCGARCRWLNMPKEDRNPYGL